MDFDLGNLGMQKLHTLGYNLEYSSYLALDCHQLPQQAVSTDSSVCCRKSIHHALHPNKIKQGYKQDPTANVVRYWNDGNDCNNSDRMIYLTFHGS